MSDTTTPNIQKHDESFIGEVKLKYGRSKWKDSRWEIFSNTVKIYQKGKLKFNFNLLIYQINATSTIENQIRISFSRKGEKDTILHINPPIDKQHFWILSLIVHISNYHNESILIIIIQFSS